MGQLTVIEKSHIARRAGDAIVWLATVTHAGAPSVRPVWFAWTGERFITFSAPDSVKLRHVERSPKVSLAFNSDDNGYDFLVVTGIASVGRSEVLPSRVPQFVEKYEKRMMERHGEALAAFDVKASVCIEIDPIRLRYSPA